MSIKPITQEEVKQLADAVTKSPTAITKQTAALAKKLFETLADKEATLPPEWDREKLEALSLEVKNLALDGLGWSDLRKLMSAIRNFRSEGVSSAHLLYRELSKEDMLAHLNDLDKSLLQVKSSLVGALEKYDSRTFIPESFCSRKLDDKEVKEDKKSLDLANSNLKAILHIGNSLIEELNMLFSSEEQGEKDLGMDRTIGRVKENIKETDELLQKCFNKWFGEYIEYVTEQIL